MTKNIKNILTKILIILLLFNTVFSSYSFSTQISYKTNIKEVKSGLEAYKNEYQDFYKPSSNDGGDYFSTYLVKLYNIIKLTTGETRFVHRI